MEVNDGKRSPRGSSDGVSDLENHSKFAKSTLTAETDFVVNEGYLKRFRSEEDRRAVFIELTEKRVEKADDNGSIILNSIGLLISGV